VDRRGGRRVTGERTGAGSGGRDEFVAEFYDGRPGDSDDLRGTHDETLPDGADRHDAPGAEPDDDTVPDPPGRRRSGTHRFRAADESR
jgi:hypothetical protein